MEKLQRAFREARTVTGKPTAIIAETIKGKGISFMEDKASWHGKAPNDAEYETAMEELLRLGEKLEKEECEDGE